MFKLFSVDDHVVEPPGVWVEQWGAEPARFQELSDFPLTVPEGFKFP